MKSLLTRRRFSPEAPAADGEFSRLANLTAMMAGAEDHFRAAPPEDGTRRTRAKSMHGRLARALSRETVRLLAAGTAPEDIGAHVRAAESRRGPR